MVGGGSKSTMAMKVPSAGIWFSYFGTAARVCSTEDLRVMRNCHIVKTATRPYSYLPAKIPCDLL